jgi:hypothetical protein
MALAHKTPPPEPVADLYETDYSRWLFENARLLREGRFSEVDIANVVEELEDMGRSEKRALRSHIAVLLVHLLKWQVQPANRSSSWRGSIYNARDAIHELLSESPSLRNRLPELIADRFPIARRNAINETELPESSFPLDCPFDIGQLLKTDYWPEPR